MAWLKEAVNPSEEQWKQWRATIVGKSGSPLVALGGDTVAVVGKALFGAIIMVISLFFFLAEGGKMLNALVRLSPLEERYLRELIDEFERVSRAVVAATLLAAAAQGVLAGIGFWCVGLRDSVALLVILTALLAMVPFAGAAAVWIPVCLYLYFYDGRAVTAGLLAVYGAGVVSTADNFIKPLVLHGQSNLHPLLALLSVLGGVTALGPIGIMVGPMAVVFLQTLLKILQREMLNLDKLNRLPLATWATGWRQGTPTAPAPLVNDTDSPTENPPPASPPQGSQPGNNKQGKKKKK
jgi:predicted PurR-regulated permease PerM